jgi:hypothetical protein
LKIPVGHTSEVQYCNSTGYALPTTTHTHNNQPKILTYCWKKNHIE